MSEESLRAEIDTLQRKLRRQRRRAGRLQRDAFANGYLDGIIATLRPGDLAVDLGANLGTVSRRLAASGADVVGFEPDPWTYDQLCAATEDLPNVTALNAAAGITETEMMLYRTEGYEDDPAKASVGSTITPGKKNVDAAGSGLRVKVIDFPGWLSTQLSEGRRVGLIKMDIEGGELDLMEALFDQGLYERVGPILVETHEKQFPEAKDRFAELRRRAAAVPGGRVNLDWY